MITFVNTIQQMTSWRKSYDAINPGKQSKFKCFVRNYFSSSILAKIRTAKFNRVQTNSTMLGDQYGMTHGVMPARLQVRSSPIIIGVDHYTIICTKCCSNPKSSKWEWIGNVIYITEFWTESSRIPTEKM